MKTVQEWMQRNVITVPIAATAHDAAKQMAKHNVSSVVIVQKNKPLGIITERDITQKLAAKNLMPDKIKAEEIMTKTIFSVSPESSILDVCITLNDKHIKKAIVLEKGSLVGIISLTDILHGLTNI
jgi:CBS domain-containing protein